MTSTSLPVTAQAFQYIEKFGVAGGRAQARKIASIRVKTREQKMFQAALWQEINRRGN
jgi:hypothetical protein